MVALLVIIIAAVGIAYIRFSHASGIAAKLISNNGNSLTIQYAGTGAYGTLYPVYGHLGIWNFGGVSPGAQACFVLQPLNGKGSVQVGQYIAMNTVQCP